MAQRFTVMLKDAATYEKYKQDVLAGGGTIVHDLKTLQGFTAEIPDPVLTLMRTGNLADNGILALDADGIATIQ
ncbi:hypothetical protein HYDPIDRAFT_107170 [Hydnomerulius pinastri MD-312]|nr:hypothetical protein HYDPIDRAFT_107170 [Hydnomerulius pinastri MD-312]